MPYRTAVETTGIMTGTGSMIASVSDTARWVAVHRAWETERPDALFRDPLASRLAGEPGRAILRAAPAKLRRGWWIVSRTRLIDELIAVALAQGCDLVLNLAAGLDARPYRMDLPPNLPWVEVDLPAMVEEKEQALAGERPRCELRRCAVDLADHAALGEFLDRTLATAERALVLTEGLLVYLEPAEVLALSTALSRPQIQWWVFDLMSEACRRRVQRQGGEMLTNAPLRFGTDDGVAYFERLGWKLHSATSLFHAAERFRRLPWFQRPLTYWPQPNPRNPGRVPWGGVVSLRH
ncbi:putative S-adenosyl-L-methionine-dependent methyltransferase [Nocardia sp. RB56]|uniref:S-adenosyl-L-methionine-dependent methyltransferase n=2 Tax=Nocardia aurantia TaxID=2585199 RepID=A0A7K0DY31_9NOCA|nr:putative S-adenosyl-L-methionine-dependent methyltransferase [Nocardia aurantia]